MVTQSRADARSEQPAPNITYRPVGDRYLGDEGRASPGEWLCELIDEGAVPGQEIVFEVWNQATLDLTRETHRIELRDITNLSIVKVRDGDG